MKRVRIEELRLRWFKGVESEDFAFGKGVNVVKGKNGAGKSTIADAICWVLFGVNQAGETKFGVKTKRADGTEVEDVEHSVEIVLSVTDDKAGDEREVTLTRVLTAVAKRDGGVTNSYTYKIDGEVETAGDYKKVVDEICPEAVFKLCSSPQTFAQMDWTEQRKMLTDMFGEPDADEVSGGEKRFDAVKELLKKDSIEGVQKHLKYKRREAQTALDGVPVRLSELNKVLPKEEDWAALAEQTRAKDEKTAEVRAKLNAIEQGRGESVREKAAIDRQGFMQKRKAIMEQEACRKAAAMAAEIASKLREERKAVACLEGAMAGLQAKASSMDELTARCEERKKELEAENEAGAARWGLVSAKTWEWDESAERCPTCGQTLPPDKVEELRRESLERFNVAVAEEKKKLGETAAKIKAEQKQCDENIGQYKAEKEAALEQAKKTETELEAARKTLKETEKQGERSVDEVVKELLGQKPEYKDVCEELAKTEAELKEKQPEDGEDAALKTALKEELDKVSAEREELAGRLAVKPQWEKVKGQIEAAEKDRKTLQEQLDELDEQLSAAAEWQKRSCTMLEERVNGHFTLVKWRMFRRQLDGTEKPWCECSVDGTPYGDLNSAKQVNAGLDIIETLKEYYERDVPCILDRAESVMEPLYNGGQQIRLTVAGNERIEIERYDD